MSIRSNLRALPTLMRIGFAEAVAYRAEMLVWILSTTMPLVMLALWSAVAREAPVGRFDQADFVAYFLVTFIIRQLTSSWVGWEINFEVRTGALSMKLLRPLPLVVGYAVENLAALPMRVLVAFPVAAVALATVGSHFLPSDGWMWAFAMLSIVGGWLVGYLSQFCMGALCFFMQSSIKVMEVWFTFFMLFSGYLFPLELLPDWMRTATHAMPFRYQIGLPVELLTSLHDRQSALWALGIQWTWVAALGALALLLWRSGLKRFAAYGG